MKKPHIISKGDPVGAMNISCGAYILVCMRTAQSKCAQSPCADKNSYVSDMFHIRN